MVDEFEKDGKPLHGETMPNDALVWKRIWDGMWSTSPAMNGFIRERASMVNGRQYVAVHVRLGSGVGERGNRFQTGKSWQQIARCMGKKALDMRERVMNGNGKVFLATDTVKFRETFKKEFGKIGGKETDVIYGNWDTKHVASLKQKVDDDSDMWKTIVMEWVLMTKAKAVVGNRSRFSEIAALVGGITNREFVELGEC